MFDVKARLLQQRLAKCQSEEVLSFRSAGEQHPHVDAQQGAVEPLADVRRQLPFSNAIRAAQVENELARVAAAGPEVVFDQIPNAVGDRGIDGGLVRTAVWPMESNLPGQSGVELPAAREKLAYARIQFEELRKPARARRAVRVVRLVDECGPQQRRAL